MIDVEHTAVDALTALLVLTDVQRERWVDVRFLGLSYETVAERDGVTPAAVWMSVQKADRLLGLVDERVAA